MLRYNVTDAVSIENMVKGSGRVKQGTLAREGLEAGQWHWKRKMGIDGARKEGWVVVTPAREWGCK